MAQRNVTDNGSWTLMAELFERGDPAFVDEVRRLTDADRLGEFAARWYADRRPEARRLLHDYLDRPLNSYRHEVLNQRGEIVLEATVRRMIRRESAGG